MTTQQRAEAAAREIRLSRVYEIFKGEHLERMLTNTITKHFRTDWIAITTGVEPDWAAHGVGLEHPAIWILWKNGTIERCHFMRVKPQAATHWSPAPTPEGPKETKP